MRSMFKIALAGMIATAAIAIAPAAASAAPTNDAATSASSAPAPFVKADQGFTMLPKAPTGRGTPFAGSRTGASTFTCNYFGYVPLYVIDFTCNVTSGAIALWVDCGGVRYYSQALPAVGTYYTRANCYPNLITNFGAISLV